MSIKQTKRMAFNFLRSYYDVINELENDKDKLDFLEAILDKQFLNKDPDGLSFIPNLCYESQRHAIEKSVKGWLRVNNGDIGSDPMSEGGSEGGSDPMSEGGSDPKEEEEEEEEKEEEKGEYRAFAHLTLSLKDADKLIALYGKVKLDDILDSIENYKQNKNYNSLYLTAGKWLKRDQAEKATQPTSHYKKFPESNQRQIATKSVSGIDLRPKK